MIQGRCKILLRSVSSLIVFEISKNFLISGRSLLLYQFTNRVIELAVVFIMGYHCYQLHTKCYRNPSYKFKSYTADL
jgi:hypothetical protein